MSAAILTPIALATLPTLARAYAEASGPADYVRLPAFTALWILGIVPAGIVIHQLLRKLRHPRRP